MSEAIVTRDRQESRLDEDAYPIVELRQYTLHDGMRERLISLFEREFVESQEAFGMRVIGTFRDLDRPDRFVWLRGFRDMSSRLEGLSGFYSGAAWLAHREEANSTMIDSDNVLLLKAGGPSAGFALRKSRPRTGAAQPSGLIVATIEYLKAGTEPAPALFEAEVKPGLELRGVSPIAWFVTETTPNNFPRLPVRSGEQVLVWFARFADEARHSELQPAMNEASGKLSLLRERPGEVLRLEPTARSALR